MTKLIQDIKKLASDTREWIRQLPTLGQKILGVLFVVVAVAYFLFVVYAVLGVAYGLISSIFFPSEVQTKAWSSMGEWVARIFKVVLALVALAIALGIVSGVAVKCITGTPPVFAALLQVTGAILFSLSVLGLLGIAVPSAWLGSVSPAFGFGSGAVVGLLTGVLGEVAAAVVGYCSRGNRSEAGKP